MLAFFSGAIWTPSFPYSSAVNNLPYGVTVDFGIVPFSSGQYLFHVEMQIGWNGAVGGTRDGDFFLIAGNSPSDAAQFGFKWGSLRLGGSGFDYGTVQSYGHWLMATAIQGQHLYLRANDQAMLLGAQLAVFNPPPYMITSPGYV